MTKADCLLLIDCFFEEDDNNISDRARALFKERSGYYFKFPGVDEHIGCRNWPNCEEQGCGEH